VAPGSHGNAPRPPAADSAADRHRCLTPRQVAALAETARAGSRKVAAGRLGIAKNTVDTHLAAAKKCGCRSDLELLIVHGFEVSVYLAGCPST
jgi:DNA-binding CsgD family transcriptional regulator